MNQKRQYKTYTKVFKEEVVALVIDQGYTVPDTTESLGIRAWGTPTKYPIKTKE